MSASPKTLPRPRLPRIRRPHMPQIRGRASGFSMPPWRVLRRRLIIAALILVALAAVYMFWFRTSSFVSVRNVEITGTEQAPDVDAALRNAADGQSTLHLDADALRSAVAEYPQVAGITMDTKPPHTLLINVDLRQPVGYVKSSGAVVAGDGVVLDHTGHAPDGLPSIDADGSGSGEDGTAIGGDALTAARILGAAPKELTDQINSAALDKDYGVTVDFGPGIELRFGDAAGAALKWKALASVLADPKFEGASYIDLSVPDRPVAGGVPDTTATATTTDTTATSTAYPTATTATTTVPTTTVPTTTTPVDPTATTVP